MAYTPPGNSGVDFGLASGYTAPANDAVDFAFSNVAITPEGTIAGTTAPVVGLFQLETDGFSAVLAGTTEGASGGFDLAAFPAGDFSINGTTESPVAAISVDHGVAGTLAGSVDPVVGQLQADHGVAGVVAGVVDPVSGGFSADHGVAATLAGTTEAVSGKIDALMIVYALSGGVKDANAVPLERRVRAYRRSTGELVAEGDSAPGSGYFDFNVGFVADEFYIAAVDLDPAATDFTPSITNRVASVLRYD